MELLEGILHDLRAARKAAAMDNMSLGFDGDRVRVERVHFGDFAGTNIKQGDVLQPTDFVKGITKLYRESWILTPLDATIARLEAQAELFRMLEKISKSISARDLERIAELLRAGQQ